MSRHNYATICLEYLREGYQALESEGWASAVAVEGRLGLSTLEGLEFVEHLERRGLIRPSEFINGAGYYRLTPEARRRLEGLPSLDETLRALYRKMDSAPALEDEKRSAKAEVAEKAAEALMSHGIAAAIQEVVKFGQRLLAALLTP